MKLHRSGQFAGRTSTGLLDFISSEAIRCRHWRTRPPSREISSVSSRFTPVEFPASRSDGGENLSSNLSAGIKRMKMNEREKIERKMRNRGRLAATAASQRWISPEKVDALSPPRLRPNREKSRVQKAFNFNWSLRISVHRDQVT